MTTLFVLSFMMQSPSSWGQSLGFILIGLVIFLITMALLYWLMVMPSPSPAETNLFERPLPNIFLGWLLLWLMSALLLMIYPFPTRASINPQRAAPPYITVEPNTSIASSDEDSSPATPEEQAAAEVLVNNGCGGCHTIQGVEGMVGIVGPELTTIGTMATERLADAAYTGAATTAEAYIEESIIQSDLFVVADYPAGVMPLNFSDTLTPEDLATIVQYLAARE